MLPFSPGPLLLLVFLLVFLVSLVQIGIISLAFGKLGLSPYSALGLLLVSFWGSLVNIPLFSLRTDPPREPAIYPLKGHWLLRYPAMPFGGHTRVAINVGGAVVPIMFCLYLFYNDAIHLQTLLPGTVLVAMISYGFSRPVPGLGIGMPVLIAPFSAAMVALLLEPVHSAPLAYCCGTLGVLIGADLLRLGDIRNLGTPMASIGGAGTFDGIFLTGIVAALLA